MFRANKGFNDLEAMVFSGGWNSLLIWLDLILIYENKEVINIICMLHKAVYWVKMKTVKYSLQLQSKLVVTKAQVQQPTLHAV